jgi:hypothetical protein
LTQVRGIQGKKIPQILGPQARGGVRRDGLVPIEAYVCARHPIKEFEVTNELGFRKDILQVPDFAPAIVAEHDIWNESSIAQVERHTRYLLRVEHSGLRFTQVMMNLRSYGAPGLVDDLAHTGQLGVLTLGYEDRLLARRDPK